MQRPYLIAWVSPVLICDRDTYITVAGGSKKDYLNKNVSDFIEKTMDDRNSVINTTKSQVSFVDSNDEEVQSYTVAPIVANGDPIGAVVIFSKEETVGEVEHKAVETAASFLARQMEQ